MTLNIPITKEEASTLIENYQTDSGIYDIQYMKETVDRIRQGKYKYMKLHYFKFENEPDHRCIVFVSDGEHTINIDLDNSKDIQLKRFYE